MLDYVTQNWFLLLAFVFVAFMLAKGPITKLMAGYGEVDPLQATRMINHEDAVVVDVREAKEWSAGHLPGACHIPLGQLGSRLQELERFRDRPIITQCRSGGRSAMAAASLKRAGFAKVFNLSGGIEAWRSAGLPIDRS